MNIGFRSKKRPRRVAVKNLSSTLRRGLKRFGPATGSELADFAYWGRSPLSRLGARWRADQIQRSAIRRAIARLKRAGECKIVGRRGRRVLYATADEWAGGDDEQHSRGRS
jgi:hypothetical protein